MIDVWTTEFPAVTGEKTRKVYVYLPTSYEKDNEKRYPVLYMFDGHNVFFDSDATYGKSWGMGEYMDYTDTEMIIAAVECNTAPGNSRLSEYSTFSFSDSRFGKVTGRGKKTMEWFVKVFKPEIDSSYRTLTGREDTFIAGSSIGWLMSLYAVLKYNKYFSAAAALSPSIWTNREKIFELIEKTRIRKGTKIYMDYGSQELKNHKDMLENFSDMTSELMKKGVFVSSRIVPNGTHSEASWEMQVPFIISELLYGR